MESLSGIGRTAGRGYELSHRLGQPRRSAGCAEVDPRRARPGGRVRRCTSTRSTRTPHRSSVPDHYRRPDPPGHGGAVALLRFVPGNVLTPNDPQDQRDMALTLAAVHATEATHRSGTFMNDLIAEMVHPVEPWVGPSVALVLDEYHLLPELTWGLLHADPESGAFLRRPDTGQVGLIDWTATTYGPVLYDVASALMYLGGRQNAQAFWNAYVSHSPAPADELTNHLGTFTRYRAAVQAAYFSMRIGIQDHTGIDDDNENWKGLRDAEHMLRAGGAEIVTPRS